MNSFPPRSPLLILSLLAFGIAALRVPAQDNKPRRPLPKPPSGSRGFEQDNRDSSSRLIAAGATRGPLKPIAPYEGLAYEARPFFAWTHSPGAASYHFTLRSGVNSTASIVYEADVAAPKLSYPADAPPLTPGQLYSWRVSTAGVMERKQGAVATFFVLAGEDAAQVKAALTKAKLTAPKTAADHLAQARIFEEYGVWYDALRIASELVAQDPNDAAAKAFYDSLIQHLKDEATKAAQQSSSLALPLWREIEPLLASGNEASATAAANRNANAASALYRELLFDAVDARLYVNPPISPQSDRARALLAKNDAENAALEAKFAAWSKERKLGEGFDFAGDAIERTLYLYIAAEPTNIKNQTVSEGAKPKTSSELTSEALQIAESIGNQLAIASCNANLAYYDLQERKAAEMLPLLERAAAIWTTWQHVTGMAGAAYFAGESYSLVEDWKTAAQNYQRAAELAAKLPALRSLRISALSALAWSLRNAVDKEGVRAALAAAVEEQQKVVKETTGDEAHLKASKMLAELETQLGGAIAALGHHVEAGEWYTRAERLRDENYQAEKAQIEKGIADTKATVQARIEANKDESYRKTITQILESYTDGQLSYLDSLASARDDLAEVARIAEQRLELARQSGDSDKIANGLQAVASAYRKSGDLVKARATAQEALSMRLSYPRHRWIYETLYLLGEIASDANDWSEALAHYREVISETKPGVIPPVYDLDAEPNPEVRPIKARMNEFDRAARASKALDAREAIGDILTRQGNFRDADKEYQKVLDELPQLYAIGAPDEAELSNWIRARGNTEIKSVDVAAHRRETGFTRSADDEQRFNFVSLAINSHRAAIISSRARMFENENDLVNAVKAYEQANAMMTNLTGGSFALSGTYVALARIERERGNYAAAEPAIEAALAEAVRKNQAWAIANHLAFKSALRRDQGKLDESKQLAEDALRIARPLASRTEIAAILRTLGRTESDLGGANLKSSEQHLREALAIWRDLGLRGHIAFTLDSLGQTLGRLGREDDALASYVEAVGIVESMTGSLSANVSTETFNASRGNRDLYDHLIKLLIKKGRAAEALSYLERAKSKALVDALAGANVNAKDANVSALLEQVRQQTDALRVAERELEVELGKPEASRDQTKIAAARAKLAAAQKNYVDAVEKIKGANPSYASLVAVNPTDLIAIRKNLPEKTLLLEYFPTDNELYIFVVTHDAEPAIRIVPIKRGELAQLVLHYREALDSATEPGVLDRSARGALWKDDGKPDFKTDVAPIKEATLSLYDALIAPAQAEVEAADSIVLVPAAELYYLPIHALGRATPNGSLDFLIERKRFAYLASADLLNAVTAIGKPSTQSSRPLLALGNPDGSLPAATEEVSTLGKMFTHASVVTGKDATVAVVAQSTAGTSYVHFATHGFINSMDPKESYLLLAGNPDRLSVKDIVEDNYKLSFSGTRIVTLSACETNLGGFDPSAVYSSLSRAFAKAGAPTVVASLWSVNDVSTKETMEVFYREIAAGQSKAESLRRAQLAVMHDPRFAHPYYWAPFVMLGDWK